MLILGPWLWQLVLERDAERAARIRTDERAEMAAPDEACETGIGNAVRRLERAARHELRHGVVRRCDRLDRDRGEVPVG